MRSPIPAHSSISAICPSSSPESAVSESSPGADAAPFLPPAPLTDLRARFRHELAARGFESDPHQLAVLERLADLRGRLISAAPAPRVRLPHWLGALAGRAPAAPPRGLYLWGGVGRGKTWLMDLFYESLPLAEKRRRHFHRFMHEVHEERRRLRRQREPLAAIARLMARETRVLCFDELYVADIADAMILGGLFAALIRLGVTLVATSNVAPQDQYRGGLQRQHFLPTIALLERNLEVLRLEGGVDYRLRRLTRAGIYLPLDGVNTPARLEALFAELACHDGTAGGTLEVEGREIAVIRSSGSVAWFEFAELCATARSADDYIEIAREYQAVIVSGVPRFDATGENEARRFIALVDELYDRNVKLIVSAAAPPGELYRGERLAGLFARTASRLTEMQSREYLAREHRP
jgi:cell division protein ZapE